MPRSQTLNKPINYMNEDDLVTQTSFKSSSNATNSTKSKLDCRDESILFKVKKKVFEIVV